ncbi:hypothetical protein [Gudongella sp. SC589]|uniref:hypothetical protein n=1 Tax=Gudongella sp. SC589 TaxID=3385990 RepID=UPI0039046CF0
MNWLLYLLTMIFLIYSYVKDRNKTKKSLSKAWKAFENILPEFLVVIIMVGLMMAILDPDLIVKVIGEDSGWLGVVLASIVGSVTLIPGFVAFPTADLLLQGGAGYMQIGAFVSTLMMVGIVTMPVEVKYFGGRITLYRNAMAFVFSYIVAYAISLVVNLV